MPVSTAFELTTNSAFVLNGPKKGPKTSGSLTIIKEHRMIRIPKNRPSTHPGEMLREEFLIPTGLTQVQLGREIKVPFQRVNEIASDKARPGAEHCTAARQILRHYLSPLDEPANGSRSAVRRNEGSRDSKDDQTGSLAPAAGQEGRDTSARPHPYESEQI